MRVGKTATRVGKSGMLQSIVQIQRKRVSPRNREFLYSNKTNENSLRNVIKIRKWPAFEKEENGIFDIFKKSSNIDFMVNR